MQIDLRSDTVTRPTKPMMEAMMAAKLGDDVFGDDPTVKALELKCAHLFGMESALFCCSGTQTNQIAIKVHTQPGDEVICDRYSHVYYYEGGGIPFNSGASVCLLEGDRGRITAEQIAQNINNPLDPHRPLTSLVTLENTMNKGGGTIYDFSEIEKIKTICTQHNLKLHLDGARLFNALTETPQTPMQYGQVFDSISVCLSKGLGAPVGSVLLGKKDFIAKALRVRKLLGGAMRQSGLLAAAGIYALDNHINRLKNDHIRAKKIENIMQPLPYIEEVLPVETNLIFFKLAKALPHETFLNQLKEHQIYAIALAPQTIRFVTHLDFTDDMLEKLEHTLKLLNR